MLPAGFNPRIDLVRSRALSLGDSRGADSMAEVEIHTEHGHENDEFGRRVGVMVGVIGIILAFVTISSHRAHTAAVIARTEANDQWSFFQSKKLRQHLAEIGGGPPPPLGNDPARVRG